MFPYVTSAPNKKHKEEELCGRKFVSHTDKHARTDTHTHRVREREGKFKAQLRHSLENGVALATGCSKQHLNVITRLLAPVKLLRFDVWN